MLFGRRKKIEIATLQKNIKKWIYTTCGYCSTGCGIEVGINAAGIPVACRGIKDHPVNAGKPCCKGILGHELFKSGGRGKFPLYHEENSKNFKRISWNKAYETTVSKLKTIQNKHGRNSVAVISSSQLYTEESYTLGKLVRGIIGTNNYISNSSHATNNTTSGYRALFYTLVTSTSIPKPFFWKNKLDYLPKSSDI